jgi:nitrite reductase (NADH) small subunit
MVTIVSMPFVKVAELEDVPEGSMFQADIADELFVLCNVKGEIHALDGRCPHAGGPLAQGALHGHTVVCPWHSWEFDCRTGATDFNPHLGVKTYPVRIEESGEVLIDVP